MKTAEFHGQFHKGDDPPQRGIIQIDEGRCRLMTAHRRIGSWELADITAERNGVYTFVLKTPDVTFTFQPSDPSAFSEAIGAVIELRAPKARFGLAERVRQANNPG